MNPHDPSQAVPASPGAASQNYRRRNDMEPLILLAFVVGWFVLQIWVLPKLGVRT